MLKVKIGDLHVELFQDKAPVACKYLARQVRRGDWAGADILDSTKGIISVGSTPIHVLNVARTEPSVLRRRGQVAFSKYTDSELIIVRANSVELETGPVVGRLTQDSMDDLEVGNAMFMQSHMHDQLEQLIYFENEARTAGAFKEDFDADVPADLAEDTDEDNILDYYDPNNVFRSYYPEDDEDDDFDDSFDDEDVEISSHVDEEVVFDDDEADIEEENNL